MTKPTPEAPPMGGIISATIQWREYYEHDETIKTELGKWLMGFFMALALLADRKQQDYGSENLTQFGPAGIVVRLTDKVARLKNLVMGHKTAAVKEESILDTWSDAMVYQAIGYLMQAGLWPEKGQKPPPLPLPRVRKSSPVLDQPPIQQSLSVINLLCTTQDIVQRLAPTKIKRILPEIGRAFRDRRTPGTVRVLGVIPSYRDHSTIGFCVLFTDISPAQSIPEQLPPHLRAEPLEWFVDHYKELT